MSNVYVALTNQKFKITSWLSLVSTANIHFQIRKGSTMRITRSPQSQHRNLLEDFLLSVFADLCDSILLSKHIFLLWTHCSINPLTAGSLDLVIPGPIRGICVHMLKRILVWIQIVLLINSQMRITQQLIRIFQILKSRIQIFGY